MEALISPMLWFAVISVGLMAGVYFTFSAFLMRSLDAIEAPVGMIAMQSINRVIVKSLFLPIFFASSAVCAALTILALLDLSAAGAVWMLIGSATYVVGMFFVTVAGNVPLNNQLEATPADGPEGATMWRRYLSKWTAWNHVRTAACTMSLAMLIVSISARG